MSNNVHMPAATYVKKRPIPLSPVIKAALKSDRTGLHLRFTNNKYEQTWKKEFYSKVKMVIVTKFQSTTLPRSVSFRVRPVYPCNTWHKKCCCPFCRVTRHRLMIPETATTYWACRRLLPLHRLKNIGDRCHRASHWNRTGASKNILQSKGPKRGLHRRRY